MPQRLKKPCAYNGCPKLVEAGHTYCENHRKKTEGYRQKIYNRESRDKESVKLYNSTAWRRLRKLKLRKDPLCEHCLKNGDITPATEVDHIVPIKANLEKKLEEDNLQSLCHRCHMIKSAEDRNKYPELQSS